MKVGINWPLSKARRSLVPLFPVLVVAPENLHGQLRKEWKSKFGAEAIALDCQDTYLRLTDGGRKPLAPGWHVASYTQLGLNKIKELPNPSDCATDFPSVARLMYEFGVGVEEAKAQKLEREPAPGENHLIARAIAACNFRYLHYSKGVGEVRNQIKCIFSPSLADLCGNAFECCVIDEMVHVKGENTIIGRAVRQLNPKFRLGLTGTPVKNRLRDLFWLLWWVAGGQAKAHARFPFGDESDQQDIFAAEYQICERNLTQEAKKREGKAPVNRRKKPRGRAGVEVCNVHKLWKLISPLILRRRKEDTGVALVPKHKTVIRVPMGTKQCEVYRYHLMARYLDKNGKDAIMAKLQALRTVAAGPTSDLLKQLDSACEGVGNGMYRSTADYIPKLASALTVIEQRMRLGEQCVAFSAFHEPLDTLSRKLSAACVPHDVLDGRKNAKWRAERSAVFAQGLPKANPVLLAGLNCMSEGHNWPLASNVILLAYDWALDVMLQCIERVHRMTSKRDVNIWAIICSGTIERKLEANILEKADAAELVIDGKLMPEAFEELNLRDLLKIAESEFRSATVYPEEDLEKEWPALRVKLYEAWQECRSLSARPQRISVPVPTLPTLMERIRKQQQLVAA
jgi:superfamily II DNA or RNA helicase